MNIFKRINLIKPTNKKFRIFVIFMILIQILGSVSLAAPPDKSTLNNKLNIHLSDDGLVKLTDDGSASSDSAWIILIDRYKKFIIGFGALASVSMVAMFIKHFVSLGANAKNPQGRSEALKGLLVTGIATALLGSVSLITYLSYTILK